MIVTGWNNGSFHESGAGYGIRLNADDRDRFFQRDWKTALLEIEDTKDVVEVNVAKPSFWGATCKELISIELGRWLIRNKLAPWRKGSPPKLSLIPVEGNRFLLKKLNYISD